MTCTQVLSLALVKSERGIHARCGQPLNTHYAQDARGVLYSPPNRKAG